MRIAITGSNGFIGNELAKYFLAQGNEVLLLQRRKPDAIMDGAHYEKYELNTTDALPELNGVDALIHTAYMPFTSKNKASVINVQGTLRLYNYCLSKGVQFIFLSSMSAHANALSEYGKHKFELEQQLDSSRCLILKLGLVIGKDGLFNRIYKSFKKMPFAILVGGGGQPVQPVFIRDVVTVIAGCVNEKRVGKFTLAVNRVYSMKELFTAIAGKAGKKPVYISMPYWIVSLGVGVVELLHLPFPVSQENLLGLKQLQPADTRADLDRLGVNLLDLKESIDLM